MAPQPKPPGQRRRRNTGQSQWKKLPAEGSSADPPKLPYKKPAWLKSTRDWWTVIWASPMAGEYLPTDQHGLLLLAELEDAFHFADTASMKLRIAAEIRHQRTAFGLTPIDRRRLQWEVERSESAQAKHKSRRRASTDPRASLGVVVDNTKRS